jgi:hypothetical protein
MSLTETPHLLLPYLAASQAQKHITHNEALRLVDALVQLSVVSRLVTPPASPVDGVRYIVLPAATGVFAGQTGKIATFVDSQWLFAMPEEGWLAYSVADNRQYVYKAAIWQDHISTAVSGAPLTKLGVNANADATNKLAVKSDAAYFSHDDVTPGTGDMRLSLNKSLAAKTTSLVFQTGYSGRAEMGLAGDDHWRIKVSADGISWKDALFIDAATGYLGIGTNAPEGPLHIFRTTAGPIIERIDSTAGAPGFISRKARGTVAAKTALIDADVVQTVVTNGYDGAAYVSCGNMRWVVEGAVSAGSVPTRIEFLNFTAGSGLTEKMRIAPDGKVGIGTTTPTSKLDVAGPVRVGQYAKAALPSATTSGTGAMIYVTDDVGGAVIAFSDGAAWRRVTDRLVVA